MAWLVPDYITPMDFSYIINRCDILEGNLCLLGKLKSGKSMSIIFLSRKITRAIKDARILVLVLRNLDVEKFKSAFNELGINIQVLTYWQFKKAPTCFDYILCDDVQLISQISLCEIKKYANHVVVTINPNLRIFEKDPLTQTSTLTIEQVQDLLCPQVYELNHVHNAFGDSVIELSKLLLDTNISSRHTLYRKVQSVHITEASGLEEETKYIAEGSVRFLKCGYSVAILLPTSRDILSLIQSLIKNEGKEAWIEKLNKWGKLDFNNLNQYLLSIGLNYQCLGSNYGHLSDINNKINVMTYHGSMGFEFDNVFLPYVNSKLFINTNDEISKSVFVMAMTRSTHYLNISYSGFMHPYLELIKDKCINCNAHDFIHNKNIFTL